jgi:phage-related protein (TIGR01555 family)
MAWLNKKSTAHDVTRVNQTFEDLRRYNAIISERLGIGLESGDPLESVTVSDKILFGGEARLQYRALDIVKRMIDLPARDSVKNGFRTKTNYDHIVDIGKMLQDRLKELHIGKVSEKYIIHYGLYARGAMLYPVIKETGMQQQRVHLAKKLTYENIEKIESLNVVREDWFWYIVQSWDPLARNFEDMDEITIGQNKVHQSRCFLTIDSLDPVRQQGVQMLQRIITACRGLNMAQWTISNLLLRYRMAVVKYPATEVAKFAASLAPGADSKGTGSALRDLLHDIKMRFTSKSVAAIPSNYEIDYLKTEFSGIAEACDYLWSFLSATSMEPQSKIKGSAQGELASAQEDEKRWNSRVESEYQKGILEPMYDFLYPMLIHEREGEIYNACLQYGIDPDDITVTTEFEPLGSTNPLEEAQVESTKAQTNVLLLQNQIRSIEQVQKEMNPESDDFAMEPGVKDENGQDKTPGGIESQDKALFPGVFDKLLADVGAS